MHKPTTGPLVVLAYSGGLDTSAIVPWLRETYGARVVCFAADVGQGLGELDGLIAKAKRSGAEDCIVEDLREEFVRDFVFPTLRAGAVYARTYLLGTSMARPLTAAHQVAVAQRLGAPLYPNVRAAVEGLSPGTRVYGVEPEGAPGLRAPAHAVASAAIRTAICAPRRSIRCPLAGRRSRIVAVGHRSGTSCEADGAGRHRTTAHRAGRRSRERARDARRHQRRISPRMGRCHKRSHS